MAGGFDENVAREMPRSGKVIEPKTPWDVPSASTADDGGGGAPNGRGASGRFASLERGKTDVLHKIRELKSELEGAFSAREDLDGRLKDVEAENRSLKEKVDDLTQKRSDLEDDLAVQKEKRESAEKRVRELEESLRKEQAGKETLREELTETRLALDEIYSALQ